MAVGHIGMSLAAESDEELQKRFVDEQWQQLAPHIAQQRELGRVVWHHDDGEVSMAKPLGAHSAALAFAGMWQVDDAVIDERLERTSHSGTAADTETLTHFIPD